MSQPQGPDPKPQSAVQGVTQVATGAIDALKGSPALLVVVLLQIATTGIVYFNAKALNEYRHEREMTMLERCLPALEGYDNPRKKRVSFDRGGTASIDREAYDAE